MFLLIAGSVTYIGTRSDAWWCEQLTNGLSQALGRVVEIQGACKLKLGFNISSKMESVRISNPDWASSKDMLTLGVLELEFDLLSLLGDTLLIHHLEVSDLLLALEENKKGKKNWQFNLDNESPKTRKKNKGITLPVKIKQLKLQRGRLSLQQPRWPKPMLLKIDTITAGQPSLDDVVLAAKGQLGKLNYTFNASFNKITHTLKGGPVTYQLDGNLGKAMLHSEGSIDLLNTPLRPDIALQLKGPDIKRITMAMGAPTIAEGPFSATVNIVPYKHGVNSNIRARFGELKLNADLTAKSLLSTENMALTTKFSGENLAALADLLGWPPLPKGAFELQTVLQRGKQNIRIENMTASVAEHKLSLTGEIGDWPKLKKTQLTLKAAGPDLAVFNPAYKLTGLGDLPTGVYNINTQIKPTKKSLQVHSARLSVGDYQASAEGYIYTDRALRAELDVQSAGPDLSMITRLIDTVDLPVMPFQVKGKLNITSKDITISNATGMAADHKVSTDGKVAFSAKGPVRLKVNINGPSLQPVLQGLGYDVIPALASYEVEGNVEYVKNRFTTQIKNVRLGETNAKTTLNIPNMTTPDKITIAIENIQTQNFSDALIQTGINYKLLHVMPAKFSGKIKLEKGEIVAAKIQGNIDTAIFKVDGIPGKPPLYENMHISVYGKGNNFEKLVPYKVEQVIPFLLNGKLSRDDGYTIFDNVRLKLANLSANVSGKLGSEQKLQDTELNISAQAPNLDVVAAIVNRPFPAGSIRVSAHITGKQNAFIIDNLNAKLGENNLNANLEFIQGERPLLKGSINSSYLGFSTPEENITTEKQSTAINKKEKVTEELDETDDFSDAPDTREQQLLFPDTPIELSLLDYLNLDVDIDIKKLINLRTQNALHDITSKILLKDRNLYLTDLKLRGASGSSVKANVKLVAENNSTRLDFDMAGKQLRLDIAATPEQTVETYPPIDIEANISGVGNTYHKLFASLTGRIKLVIGEGRVSNSRVLSILSDTFYELFNTVNPFAKTESTTRLSCGVGIASLDKGIATISAAVFQTDKLTIVSGGTVDLKTEQLNVGFNTRPRRGLGISISTITDPFIKLGGSLLAPQVELDAEGATLATSAAVATGGLSFLFKGVWDRFFSSRDPCGEALENDAAMQKSKNKPEK